MLYDLQCELVQRNNELEAFSHTVAHDLKNPLNIIVGSTDKPIDQNSPIPPLPKVEKPCVT
jgi:light-regulated signal transduction histidine kinase (bacteriophytochrome)